MSQQSQQGRRWCFTIYNEEDLHVLRQEPHDACVAAWEEGTENKHKHLQVYIKFSANKRLSWFQKKFPSEGRTIHFELAKGPEWKCRRYIADVEAYLRDEPGAHSKEQGRVIHDYGCDIPIPEGSSAQVRCVKAIADGAKLVQLWRAHPIYFYNNYRKLRDLHEFLQGERERGEDVKPTNWEDSDRKYKKARPAKDSENDDVDQSSG